MAKPTDYLLSSHQVRNKTCTEQHNQSIKTEGAYSLVNLNSASPKKPYQKPTLRVYGDIRDLTKSMTAASGNFDSVGMLATKTV